MTVSPTARCRVFLSDARSQILGMNAAAFELASRQCGYDTADQACADAISAAVELSLEQAAFGGANAELTKQLWTAASQEVAARDLLLQRKQLLLQGRPQEHFDIDPALHSSSEWLAPREALQAVAKARTPGEMLECACATVHSSIHANRCFG